VYIGAAKQSEQPDQRTLLSFLFLVASPLPLPVRVETATGHRSQRSRSVPEYRCRLARRAAGPVFDDDRPGDSRLLLVQRRFPRPPRRRVVAIQRLAHQACDQGAS
jgi:hypothetical protein